MEKNSSSVDNEFDKFPPHMRGVRNVFEFSYAAADRAAQQFRSNTDIMRVLDQVLQAIMQSTLPVEDKEMLNELLRDEKKVVSFAQISRNSVIAI